MKRSIFWVLALAACGWLGGCSAPPPSQPDAVVTLMNKMADAAQLGAKTGQGSTSAPVYTASFSCQDGNTPAQNVVCGNQQLAASDTQMAAIFRQNLAQASLFGRDELLADQRGWLLGLPGQCNITGAAAPGPDVVACLANAYTARIGVLTNWPVQPGAPLGAIAKYVTYKLLDAKQPAYCSALTAQAPEAMSDDGSLDPTRLNGAVEIAGSHGSANGSLPGGGTVTVGLYQAGLYGSYQIRARTVTLGSDTVLNPNSLGADMETIPDVSGRFDSFASQTSDYGAIDVFTLGGQPVALLTDVIGYDSPAPPGEASVAGLYTLSGGTATLACLYQTYLMPPSLNQSVFADLPSLTPFLALVDEMRAIPIAGLSPSDRQDSSVFADETRWTMLNMPLIGVAQAQGGWINWLRYRHDQVLDALYQWSIQSPQNTAQFQQLFALLRPAAIDLDTVYVQRQGLSGAQAQQATALAMMEFLYQAAASIAPALGGLPENPAAVQRYQPRYPILATPN